MKTNKTPGGLVYSTEHGRMCPSCRKPLAECVCRQAKPPSASAGGVRVHLETKGRRGKGVTVIAGVPLGALELAQLGKQLKTQCGSGGTVKEGVIEIQGDHVAAVAEALRKLGWTVK